MVPVLILIVLRGKRAERFPAATYLLFYTLVSGVPLLVICFWLHTRLGVVEISALRLGAITTFDFYEECFI